MCGIAGFCAVGMNKTENILKMNAAMHERGPDGSGYWWDDRTGVTLGHTRLAILDLTEAGAQPMLSHNQRFVISYNGEIYNFKELKDELIKCSGITFKSSSDTEVLVEAFAEWGCKKTLHKLRGMYAIAFYDREQRKLSLMRDCMGEKPLYYGYVNGSFVFASDVKAIRNVEGFRKEIDEGALSLYFKYGYIPAPYSIYKGIYKLEPAEILTTEFPFVDYKIEKYWDLKNIVLQNQSHMFRATMEEAAEELELLIRKSVKQMMIADVPIGCFLSGGTDSSFITALMQQSTDRPVNTFTIGFEQNTWDEAAYAKQTAQYFGTNHTEMYLGSADLEAAIFKMPFVYAEPFADNSQIVTYLVSKLARKDVTVTLSGDGGDELFAGYSRYGELEKIWNRYRADKSLRDSQNIYKEMLYQSARSIEQMQKYYYEYAPQLNELVISQERYQCVYEKQENIDWLEPIHVMMLKDQRQYLPDDILVKVDRAGMAVSLENRIPLLHRDVVEFAWSLPLKWKLDEEESKKILRKILYKNVPKELMDRPKRGFNMPMAALLRNQVKLFEWAEYLLDIDKIRKEGILDANVVSCFWKQYKEHENGWRPVIWYLLMFEAWLEAESKCF